ncbi:hypothetical protein [Burkholderia stagnalis]|uniref:hypothetical protein n=1 Tax=Burkholderia stagnalis TaxID=1503054 RepID=UPI001ED9AACB|nr:hypothetical protein [Burkholderia stagnalis]
MAFDAPPYATELAPMAEELLPTEVAFLPFAVTVSPTATAAPPLALTLMPNASFWLVPSAPAIAGFTPPVLAVGADAAPPIVALVAPLSPPKAKLSAWACAIGNSISAASTASDGFDRRGDRPASSSRRAPV